MTSDGQDDLGQDDFGAGDELPETVPAAEWPVGATAGVPAGGAARRRRRISPVPVTVPGEQAPWDMVGDWDSAGRRRAPTRGRQRPAGRPGPADGSDQGTPAEWGRDGAVG